MDDIKDLLKELFPEHLEGTVAEPTKLTLVKDEE